MSEIGRMGGESNPRHFDHRWEAIYAASRGKHLNKYPFGELVSVFFRSLPHLATGAARPEAMRVLELGCGAGNNLMLPLNQGMATFGVDGSASAIGITRGNYRQAPNRPGLCAADFCYLPYADDSFDVVIDRESVCANDRAGIGRAFGEVARVLKPGGLYLSFMYSRNDGHRLRALSESGHATEVEPDTFAEFRGGTFEGTGKVHFFSQEEIIDLCAGRLEILQLYESLAEQIIPVAQNQRSEYILVARK